MVTGTEPESGTLLFDAKEFVIHFDEYVKVKDADNNILVSPPMKQKPEYKTKGRGIVVKLRDTLRANTTYLFQFKEAIVDFNEGNALPSYEYVFSTGSSIDSMTLRGTVADAFSRKPRTEPVTVIAWSESQQSDSVGDSIVAKVQPKEVEVSEPVAEEPLLAQEVEAPVAEKKAKVERTVTLTERDIPITRPENYKYTPEEIALLKKQANEAYLKWVELELEISRYTLEQTAQK